MKISIVMVTLNEELAIETVVKELRNVAPEAEILIVDSSKDKTPQIAESLGIRVIRQFPPRGYGWALDLALKSAQNDIVISLDCDNTYPPNEIPKIVKYIEEEGYDFVDASRLMGKRPANMPLPNYIANMFFVYFARIMFRLPVTDLHSGMRAYKKDILAKINWDPSGPALPVELLLKPILLGFKCKGVGIEYRVRIGSTNLDRIKSTYWTFKRLFRLKWQQIITNMYKNPPDNFDVDLSFKNK